MREEQVGADAGFEVVVDLADVENGLLGLGARSAILAFLSRRAVALELLRQMVVGRMKAR